MSTEDLLMLGDGTLMNDTMIRGHRLASRGHMPAAQHRPDVTG